MAVENFLAYSETDPNSRITRTTRLTTWADIIRGEDAYVWRDKGTNYFDGSFVHYLTVNSVDLTAPSGQATTIVICWAVGNTVGSWQEVKDVSGDQQHLYIRVEGTGSKHKLLLGEVDGGAPYNSAGDIEISGNTPYYLKIVRNESDSANGTLYCYVYSDPGRETLVGTLTLELHTSKKDFRYVYAMQSIGFAVANYDHTGYTENLELFGASDPSVLPTVTTQAVTSITATSATGNGIIVDLGLSAVSQHGICWDILLNPTTSTGSGFWGKTSEGEGTVGSFTSSMGSLLAGMQYNARAYATNTGGTAYGANVTFTATSETTSTQLIQGNLAIVQGRLQYIDASGIEKYIQGTPT